MNISKHTAAAALLFAAVAGWTTGPDVAGPSIAGLGVVADGSPPSEAPDNDKWD